MLTGQNLSSRLFATLFFMAVAWNSDAAAQTDDGSGYRMPPADIADLADAPLTPSVSISPTGDYMLLLNRPGMPGIDEVAQPELRIAGLRINPRTNGPSRGYFYSALTFQRISDDAQTRVNGLPEDAKLSNVHWSPDGQWIAFTVTLDDEVALWAADLASGQARALSTTPMNAAYGSPYTWMPDSRSIIARTIPRGSGPAPPEPSAPSGPAVQENAGGKRPARTYQDLLKDSYDESLFEHHVTSQVVQITLDGDETPLGAPAIYRQATPSPDGQYILVETIHRPFSYTVPAYRFPRSVDVWDADGHAVRQIADLPLADNVPIAFGSVRTGPRDVSWRQDVAATLVWAEALDGGDAGVEADERDGVYLLEAPFEGDPKPLVTMGLRFYEMHWSSDDLALATEYWWKTRQMKVWAIKPGSPDAEPKLLKAYSFEDRYNDPGDPVTRQRPNGTSVLLMDQKGKRLFLSGSGASPEGDRPFLDALDVTTGKTERWFRSEAPHYERFVTLLDARRRTLLTRRESVAEPPNLFVRDLKRDKIGQLTDFPHPQPQLADVQKEMIRYKRADGLDLTGTLYLPAGYNPATEGPLPMLMWAYPQEFKSADAAGQVTDSPYRFVRVSTHSPLYWLVHGYAVLDDPTLPIVGEGDEEPNDTYVEQLVAGAQAAVDEVVRRGVADRDRIAIGGHSYGAFMTANLLAHSDLFAAGIARSGAYNRTLTPFGFQAEERTYWEAPEVYFAMSPFMHAEKVNEPILLIHGAMDNNSGTFPIQSERYYGALKGHGATVRLAMLPHESHGYRARESVMHMLWEMTEWLDRYVKDQGGTKTPVE